MKRLEGKVALVTGASRGIGRGIAEAFQREGAQVATLDVELPERPLDGALAISGSVGRRADVEAAVAACVERLGGLDVAVCNAGLLRYAPILELDDETWQAHVDVNLTGTFLTAQAAGRAMAASGRGGSIVAITSTVAAVAVRAQGHYCAVKAGAQMLASSMAWELAEHGIRVNAIAPGWVDTRFAVDHLGEASTREAIERTIPLGRIAQPRDVAAAAVFLASDDAAYVTGTTVKVDGGVGLGRENP